MKRTLHIVTVTLVMVIAIGSTAAGENAEITGIIGAFGDEVALIHAMLEEPEEQSILGIVYVTGELGGRRIVLTRSGVGKVNAAAATILLIEHFHPAEIIFTGIAGGINPELRPGDIVIAGRTAQHDLGDLTADSFCAKGVRNPVDGVRNPVYIPADSALAALAASAAAHIALEEITAAGTAWKPRVVHGTVVSGDVFVASTEKKRELRASHDADAVEMEGAAVAQVCFQQRVPCLVIRSLSDSADESARSDFETFRRTAARNSAMLVVEMVKMLGE